AKDLKDTAIIHIGRAQPSDSTFSRVLHLIKDPTIHRLVRQRAATAENKTLTVPAAMGEAG
ncbi:MAG TPA: hypothetical protein VII70_07745, partial [Steroidobacteraceae bacterium]